MVQIDAVQIPWGGGKNDSNTDITIDNDPLVCTKTPLKQYGDFRSEECIELLQEADIVVTNPPFSLFREYVAQLVKYNKKFIIIGNPNAIICKEIFPLIKNNKIWLGNKSSGNMWFRVPCEFKQEILDGKRKAIHQYIDDIFLVSCQAIFYTNFKIPRYFQKLDLYAKYNPEKYLKYDNYDAIDISKISDIPEDYYGIMGVPINFLGIHNYLQFELIGIGTGYSARALGVKKNYRGRTDLAYTVNGIHKCPYSRILIKRIHNDEVLCK